MNEDEMSKLSDQLLEVKRDSRIVQQELLETHRDTVRSIEKEKIELQVKLDQVERELASQQKINTKQATAHQDMQNENTILTKKNESI